MPKLTPEQTAIFMKHMENSVMLKSEAKVVPMKPPASYVAAGKESTRLNFITAVLNTASDHAAVGHVMTIFNDYAKKMHYAVGDGILVGLDPAMFPEAVNVAILTATHKHPWVHMQGRKLFRSRFINYMVDTKKVSWTEVNNLLYGI